MKLWLLSVLLLALACNSPRPEGPAQPASTSVPPTSWPAAERDSLIAQPDARPDTSSVTDTSLVNVSTGYPNFTYDLRYATPNNFLGKAVYPCATCLLRKEVAQALQQANREFISQGFRLRIFDCYRPLSVQKAMWQVMPDSRYVANPYRSGSVHNRGAAVDLSLETLAGETLDMGTAFDHFGPEAHHNYTQLSDTVQANRELLKQGMEAAGFIALPTEWWHYNFGVPRPYAPANKPLCPTN